MTSASSLAFPGSRTLATWWRQLAPFQPDMLCAGYLFIHRLDICACFRELRPLDPLLAMALEAFALEAKQPPSAGEDALGRRLHLELPALRGLLRSLADLKLIEGRGGAFWALTELGREALTSKAVWSPRWRRGQFSFVESLSPVSARRAPPHFLKVHEAPAASWHPEESAAFALTWLYDCVRQDTGWKKTFGFPLDLVEFAQASSPAASWQRVVIDRPERLLVAFCRNRRLDGDVLGFGVRPEGWILNAAEPIIRLPAAASGVIPEIEEVPPERWKQAWLEWCRSRQLPPADAAESSLRLEDERLLVNVPSALLQSLQASKSDVLKGETWLLAGDGYLRSAARVVVATS
jgi:hypothetical protein